MSLRLSLGGYYYALLAPIFIRADNQILAATVAPANRSVPRHLETRVNGKEKLFNRSWKRICGTALWTGANWFRGLIYSPTFWAGALYYLSGWAVAGLS